MSTLCEELPGRSTGYAIDDKGIWSFTGTRQFQVLATSRLTGFESVSGLPPPGESWSGLTRLRVAGASATEAEEIVSSGDYSWRWTVTINYTSRAIKTSQNEMTTHPISASPIWGGWKAEQITTTPMKDLDGKKWLNTANDPFSDVPQITINGASVTVTKNYTSFSGAYALSLIGKCNSGSFSGAEKGQLILADIVPTEKNNGEMTYYEVAFTIKYNPLGWDYVEILNSGSHVKTIDGEKKLPVDASGQSYTGPALLDVSGSQIDYADERALDSIRYIKFRVAEYTNFTALNLI